MAANTEFRHGDSDYDLLRKILTLIGGLASLGDSPNDLLRKILTRLGVDVGSGGATLHTGSGAPAVGLGADGDIYIDTDGPIVYEKILGAWSLLVDLTPDAHSTLTYANPATIDFAGDSYKTISLTGNCTFQSANLGTLRSVTVRIICDGTPRNLGFPGTWKFVGPAAPASIAASKVAILSLIAYGNSDSDVVAGYAVEA
jgi:hypothetical protein